MSPLCNHAAYTCKCCCIDTIEKYNHKTKLLIKFKHLLHRLKAKTNSKGFSLIEILLAVAVFGLFAGGFLLSYIHGQQSTLFGGQRTRASYLAEEGLEAVRNMRDENYANLINGTHGLDISGNEWIFSGTSDITDGFFTRTVEVNELDAFRKEITSTVTWQQTSTNQGSVELATYLTDWSRTVANQVFRVTEYYIALGSFPGNTYDLVLNQNLSDDYFVMVQGSDGNGTSNGNRGPDENYISLIEDPNGTGDLDPSGNTNVLAFQRANSVNSWVGVITVVECIADCTNGGSGFRLTSVSRVPHPSGVLSDSYNAPSSFNGANRTLLMGGFNGAGCDTTDNSNNDTKVCHVRFWPSGGNNINWERDDGGAGTFGPATSTVMAIRWGNDWNLQRVNVTGNNGGNGVDSLGEYDTANINSVSRDNTWVWGTGYTTDNGIGDAAEGVLITLGDGVNQNANESTVAVGMEYNDDKNFEVYVLTHPNLAVDYQFKNDGDSGALTFDVAVDAANNATNRMAIGYNGTNGTGGAYPRPMFSYRYFDNATIRMERRRSGQNFPAWIQGIDFSGIVD